LVRKISVPHESLLGFILDAIKEINEQNDDVQFIKDAFCRCGMNPWSKEKSLNLFKQYLDNFEENDLLCAMLSNQEAVSLF
jgi:hypothetical protein